MMLPDWSLATTPLGFALGLVLLVAVIAPFVQRSRD